MNESLQPPIGTERLALSPKELLVRNAVINLATTPSSYQDPYELISWGHLNQKRGARFLYAQITSQRRLIQEGLEEPYLDHVLELHAYDSLGDEILPGERRKGDGKSQIARGSEQILTLSARGVAGLIDGQAFAFDNSAEGKAAAARYIDDYFRDNYLNEIPRLFVAPKTAR